MGRFGRVVNSKHIFAEGVSCCRGKRDETWGDGEELKFFGGASEENNLWEKTSKRIFLLNFLVRVGRKTITVVWHAVHGSYFFGNGSFVCLEGDL